MCYKFSWVFYEVASSGDPDAVGVFLLGAVVDNNVCICDRAVGRDLLYFFIIEFVPFVAVLLSSFTKFLHSFPKNIVQSSFVSVYFANFLQFVIYLPVIR